MACLLLTMAAALVLAAHSGYAESYTPGVVTLVAATAVGIASLVFSNLSSIRQAADIRTAMEQAHRLSQGEFIDDLPTSALGDSLKEASDWVDQYRKFWEASFDRLDEYLKVLQAQNVGETVNKKSKRKKKND